MSYACVLYVTFPLDIYSALFTGYEPIARFHCAVIFQCSIIDRNSCAASEKRHILDQRLSCLAKITITYNLLCLAFNLQCPYSATIPTLYFPLIPCPLLEYSCTYPATNNIPRGAPVSALSQRASTQTHAELLLLLLLDVLPADRTRLRPVTGSCSITVYTKSYIYKAFSAESLSRLLFCDSTATKHRFSQTQYSSVNCLQQQPRLSSRKL